VFEVASGKGVYMRSLARDLARACGTLGHVAALRRLRVGPFTEAQAIPLDKLLATGGYPAGFPGPPASGRDRAGRHPGAGPDRGGGRRPEARPGDQPGRADGPHSTAADPDGGLARAMAGDRVIGLCRLEDGC
jgi:tRNA pseudouridine55 synthase